MCTICVRNSCLKLPNQYSVCFMYDTISKIAYVEGLKLVFVLICIYLKRLKCNIKAVHELWKLILRTYEVAVLYIDNQKHFIVG